MAQVVAVYRDNCTLTLIAPKHGQGVAFKLSSEVDAVLLECVLMPMCSTACNSVVSSKSGVSRESTASCNTYSTSSSSCNSSNSSSYSSSSTRYSTLV
jgi:hypothetical protein